MPTMRSTSPRCIETLKFLWTQRATCHLMLGSALTALWGWGLTWWTPAFLMRNYGLTAGQAGEMTGPIHLVAGIAATVFTAWLLGRPFMYDPRRVVWFLASGITLATIPSIIIFWTHSLALTQAMFWIFIPFIYFYIGPGFGLLNNLSPPRMRAQFCAVVAAAGQRRQPRRRAAAGRAFLSDYFAPGHVANAESLRLALLCLAPTGFWSAYHYFSCARTLPEDQERALAASALTRPQATRATAMRSRSRAAGHARKRPRLPDGTRTIPRNCA